MIVVIAEQSDNETEDPAQPVRQGLQGGRREGYEEEKCNSQHWIGQSLSIFEPNIHENLSEKIYNLVIHFSNICFVQSHRL